jgi:CheY-like chemotaxis protein
MKQFNLPVDNLSLEKKRILVGTSDDHLFSQLQRVLSEDERVELERAGFGGDVLISCSKTLPDLLILDEELADIPCMEIIRSLRRMTTDQPGLKILCSAKSRNSRRCVEWGADEALPRESSDPEEWGRMIYTFLNIPRSYPKRKQTTNTRGDGKDEPSSSLKIGIYSIRTPYRRKQAGHHGEYQPRGSVPLGYRPGNR